MALTIAETACSQRGYDAVPAAWPIYDLCVKELAVAAMASPARRDRMVAKANAELAPLIASYNQQAYAYNQQLAYQQQLAAQQQAQAEAQQAANQAAYAAAVSEQQRQARMQQSIQLMQLGARLMQGSSQPTSTHTYVGPGGAVTCTNTGTVTNCN